MASIGDFFRRLSGKRPAKGSPARERGGSVPARRISRGALQAPGADAQAPAFPSFRASAIDRPLTRGERSELLQARLLLRDVFTPAQPVTERARFAGRLGVLVKLIEIIEEQRSHVVVYGERGIGKTSLMHILADVARESHYLVTYASCGAHSRFDEIFRAILKDIPLLFLSSVSPTGPEAEGGATVAERLPDGPFNARQLGDLCAEITGTRVLIILDEYDRIQDPDFRQNIAELIKNLSDRAARVQIVLAGVASNLQELIGYIPSVRRNVIGLPMPRLSAAEVRSLIKIGENAAGVSFDEQVIRMIELFANGSPYLARLLSHHSSMMALDAERMTVELPDIWAALDKVVDEAESRIARRTAQQVQKLFLEQRREFVGAAARAASTPDGWFTGEDVAQILPAGGAPATHAAELDRLAATDGMLDVDREGDVLRYRFRDEALPTYLWMMIARDHFRDGGNVGGVSVPARRSL